MEAEQQLGECQATNHGLQQQVQQLQEQLHAAESALQGVESSEQVHGRAHDGEDSQETLERLQQQVGRSSQEQPSCPDQRQHYSPGSFASISSTACFKAPVLGQRLHTSSACSMIQTHMYAEDEYRQAYPITACLLRLFAWHICSLLMHAHAISMHLLLLFPLRDQDAV